MLRNRDGASWLTRYRRWRLDRLCRRRGGHHPDMWLYLDAKFERSVPPWAVYRRARCTSCGLHLFERLDYPRNNRFILDDTTPR